MPVRLAEAMLPMSSNVSVSSILLGHTSIRITEKHYTPWVRARQEQAEADVRGAWAQDPVALLETKGTPEVHGKSPAVN